VSQSTRHGTRHLARGTRHLVPVAAVRVLAVASFAIVTLGPTLHGQEGLHVRSASSDLVVLSATVVDKNGGFVEGLARDRFVVADDGARQPIDLFSHEDTPVAVGLIIDNSASMRPKMGEVVAATSAFARSSHPEDELFTLSFNDTVHEALKDRAFLLASDVAALEEVVSSLRPEGRTALYDAVIAGLDRLDESSRSRKVLIVMSDGGDNMSRATLDQTLERARRSDATIYTIGLFEPDDQDANPGVLKSLARATGGERYLPPSAGPLLAACRRIAREIRSGYTIAFEPSKRDGRYHRVQVDVDRTGGRRLSVRTRPGYFAPAPVRP
jgi:Ca-activated chloride channel family protein